MVLSRRKLPALNALRAFEVSGRRLSFRSAAEELGVTQGAVAQQVRALEDTLGFLLFERLARGLALTPKGKTYLQDMTKAFDIMAEATDAVMARSDIVTISVTPTFAAKLLIPRLGDLQAQFPQIELRTVATEAVSQFDADQIDIAVRLTKSSFPSNLQAAKLFPQELVAVASPLILKEVALPLTLDELRHKPLLHDAHNHWPMVLQSKEAPVGARFNQTALAIDAAVAGQGVVLACRAFVAKDIELGRLVDVLGRSYVIEPDYFLVRKRSAQASPAVEAVWLWCLAEYGGFDGDLCEPT
ncbi:LysR family transcriptional regulator [Marinomonas sp. A79]|uniref:LysR family transcriptional regulator n=1 Tax=Marinomonas vulgaris TaxID=2823372 RepID=A0ABS5H742_9GAMM|nr:LysR substrate-binding domain-containing protein [Marinomonas vulgaris]MBR7887330.1 LysR family transcriptional regulator [Marinomonas vulgaris]